MFKYYIIPYILLFSALTWRLNIDTVERQPSGFGIFPDVTKVDENHELEYRTTKLKIEEFIKYTSYDGHFCNDHYRGDFSKLDNPKSKNIISSSDLAQEIYDLSNWAKNSQTALKPLGQCIVASLSPVIHRSCGYRGTTK